MYGITSEIKTFVKEKIQKKVSYLSSHYINIDGYDLPLIKFVKNAIINPDRYIAELNNRAYSLYNYAESKNLKNIFLTLTLPSKYHPKYKTFDNKNYNPELTIKDGVKELNSMFREITNQRLYRSIEKDKRVYFRVIEPHKSGIPHLHISFFIPAEFVDSFCAMVKQVVEKNFQVQYNLQSDIYNPVAYLMKYILKTFDDLRHQKDNISELSIWYIYHGIRRFYTSQTFINLETYRKLLGRYNLLELTNLYNDGKIQVFLDENKKVVAVYDEIGEIYSKRHFETFKLNLFIDKTSKPCLESQKERIQRKSYIIDDIKYHKIDDDFIEVVTASPISKMTNSIVFEKYQNFDVDNPNSNLAYYALLRNELINRGILDEEYINPNVFYIDSYFDEIELDSEFYND